MLTTAGDLAAREGGGWATPLSRRRSAITSGVPITGRPIDGIRRPPAEARRHDGSWDRLRTSRSPPANHLTLVASSAEAAGPAHVAHHVPNACSSACLARAGRATSPPVGAGFGLRAHRVEIDRSPPDVARCRGTAMCSSRCGVPPPRRSRRPSRSRSRTEAPPSARWERACDDSHAGARVAYGARVQGPTLWINPRSRPCATSPSLGPHSGPPRGARSDAHTVACTVAGRRRRRRGGPRPPPPPPPCRRRPASATDLPAYPVVGRRRRDAAALASTSTHARETSSLVEHVLAAPHALARRPLILQQAIVALASSTKAPKVVVVTTLPTYVA